MARSFLVMAVAAGSLALVPCLSGDRTPAPAWATEVAQNRQPADTATVKLHISGMTCGGCATTARLALKKLGGVFDATVSIQDSLGVVRYDPEKTTPPKIAEHLTRLTGYRARIVADSATAVRTP